MTVRLERSGAVARIVLARPDALNALTGEMTDRIDALTQELQHDDSVRCVLISGQAHRRDIGLASLEKPVIAAVRGAAVGVGFSLALASDLMIVSETARFGLVFKKIGLARMAAWPAR